MVQNHRRRASLPRAHPLVILPSRKNPQQSPDWFERIAHPARLAQSPLSPQARRGQAQRRQAQGGQARGGQTQRGKGRPLPPGDSLYTQDASQARRRIEHASARPLLLLHQLPVWLAPIVVAALLVTGLAVPGLVGGIALLLVAGFLSWLAALSWPQTKGSSRLLRLAAVACVLAVAVIQAGR